MLKIELLKKIIDEDKEQDTVIADRHMQDVVRFVENYLKAAGIDELLEDNRKMREVLEYFLGCVEIDDAAKKAKFLHIAEQKAKQILAQMGE